MHPDLSQLVDHSSTKVLCFGIIQIPVWEISPLWMSSKRLFMLNCFLMILSSNGRLQLTHDLAPPHLCSRAGSHLPILSIWMGHDLFVSYNSIIYVILWPWGFWGSGDPGDLWFLKVNSFFFCLVYIVILNLVPVYCCCTFMPGLALFLNVQYTVYFQSIVPVHHYTPLHHDVSTAL